LRKFIGLRYSVKIHRTINLIVGQIMVLANFVMSKRLCSLHGTWERIRP